MNSTDAGENYVEPFSWRGLGYDDYVVPYDVEELIPAIKILDETSIKSAWLNCLRSLKGYSFFLCYDPQNQVGSNVFPNPQWTFQHHCAYYNAPASVVEEMIKMKHPFSYRDNLGKMPMDYVRANSPPEYKDLFQPKGLCQKIGFSKILKMEQSIHKIIKERAGHLLKQTEMCNSTILPMLSVYYENVAYNNLYDPVSFSITGLDMSFSYGIQREYEFNDEENDFDVSVNPEVICFEMYRVPDYILGRKYLITENSCSVIEDHFY